MRVMVFVKATKSSEAGEMPDERMLTEMGKYNEELSKAGILLAGEGLHPSSRGKRVRFAGEQRTVIDGPFAETKEVLGGFNLIEAENMEEAVRLAAEFPWAQTGCIEVRAVRDIDAVRQKVGLERAAHAAR